MTTWKTNQYYFLENGGEMGELIRDHDWSLTRLGSVDQWPQSLRTIVDIIVHSQIPMLLWWGEDLIQFYNDAFCASLGAQGKHPSALGQRADICWSEIWPMIDPLVQQVRAGNPLWREDQLIPAVHNGSMRPSYWSFGYSPVHDEVGIVAGVLVVCQETTKQVEATKRLQQSEQTLRSIVEGAPVGICIVDSGDLKPELVNDVLLTLSGKTREEFLSKKILELFPELKDLYADLLASVIRTGKVFHRRENKVTYFRSDRQVNAYLDFVIQPLNAANGPLSGKLMIIVIDVTEKVLARMAIAESEQRYRTLITESTVAIALYIGPELRIQYVNEIMTGYWGKDMSVVGKPLLNAVPELDGQPFLEILTHVFETGETYVGKEEEAMLNVGGNLRPFYFNYVCKPLRDAHGKVYGIHNMAMDVTEQVLARKKVEQNEATMRNVILKAPVAMSILKGPEFVVEIANDLMFDLWGKPKEAIIHRPVFEALPEIRFQGFEEILERVFFCGESFSAKAVPSNVPRGDRVEKIYTDFLYEPFREADESVSGVFVAAVDVTEQVIARQKVEELVAARTKQLAETNKNLKRSNDELAQFAYIASHDLQEPARKITMFAEMLHRNIRGSDTRSELLIGKIQGASKRMLSLIRDVLAYSQLSKGKSELVKVDLNKVLKNVLEDFELLIEEKKATIQADELPIIAGIPVQISQLFANLISNALKFTSKSGTPKIVITSSAAELSEVQKLRDLKRGHGYFRISFSDNGIGFNEKNARQIFDIFQRLHGQSEYEGTGIGLAMCKKIAQNHHGDIIAESVEGKGSTFHVFLPKPLNADK